jgi:acyl-CoA synthetase (AMP-forming)/AMP-acid ligase II/thioesterase domain-containing protein
LTRGGTVIAHIATLIDRAARTYGQGVAFVAPGRPPLAYAELPELTGAVARRLRERGVEPGDRVALVVRNGPEAASAFLALACSAVCAPLNPTYQRDEFDFYLGDLGARAVVVGSTVEAPVRLAAQARGIPVLELEPRADAPAGWFSLDGPLGASSDVPAPAADDVALVLHTSGTTSKPKLVPLKHGNLTASARNVAATLELSPGDRCLSVMPLFHIHGLVAALLASIEAGASVACTPGFHPLHVFDWLRDLEPTWYTAVPTMHQSLLARWHDHEDVARGHRLRLARSSSASLPVPVFERLEETLGVPVIEAYGMTEAAHQMASNALPPGRRVPGSVGIAAGPEIAVLGPDGEELTAGSIGEVAIRGDNVFSGYEANPEANAAAFVDGWFRTGDQGALGEDGYLVLHGRLKEIINRGGEKVAPIEIDERLLSHPAVAQAVTFAMPSAQLGEEVAAAIVLAPGSEADEATLQDHVAQTLAPFKVPRRVVFVDELPKGPTGKVQRIGLADRLGVEPAMPARLSESVAPTTPLELALAQIWADVLGLERVGVHDDFFALGGDSILGTEATARIRDLTGRDDLPLVTIVRAPSVAAMAGELGGSVSALGTSGAIAIQPNGVKRPLFFVHGADGEVLPFVALARRLGEERPFLGFRAHGIDGGAVPDPNIETVAADYVAELRGVQPRGPYVIGGFCMGATVAIEMARMLEDTGEEVEQLVLVDPRFPRPTDIRYRLWWLWRRLRGENLGGRVAKRLRRLVAPSESTPPAPPTEVWQAFDRAREAYTATATEVPATVVFSKDYLRYNVPEWSTLKLLPRVKRLEHVDADHPDLFRQPAVDELAARLRAALDESP